MKNQLGTIIGATILLVLGVIGWKLYQQDTGSSITVIEQIKKVAKLQTIEMKAAVTMKRTKTGLAKQKRHTTYFAEGTVTAGIDLEKMEMEFDPESNLVTIKLPKVEVSNASHDSFDIVCTTGNLVVKKFTDAERSKHTNQAFGLIRNKALKAGIKKMALAQAKEYLTTFIEALDRKVAFK